MSRLSVVVIVDDDAAGVSAILILILTDQVGSLQVGEARDRPCASRKQAEANPFSI